MLKARKRKRDGVPRKPVNFRISPDIKRGLYVAAALEERAPSEIVEELAEKYAKRILEKHKVHIEIA